MLRRRKSVPSNSRVPPSIFFPLSLGGWGWGQNCAGVGIRHGEWICADSAVLGPGASSHGVSVQQTEAKTFYGGRRGELIYKGMRCLQ